MSPVTSGLAQAVHTRLIRDAKETELDPNLTLTRHATERLLYRDVEFDLVWQPAGPWRVKS